MKKNNIYILFSLIGVLVVLWSLLSSGYVLTLDMVFGPHFDLTRNTGDLLNTVPLWYFLAFLTYVFGGWIAQKILLIILFFLLFYLPLHFFKKIFNIENTHGAEYVMSLVFVVNPFVYERFLAGQWAVIFGYALLVPFTAYLFEFCKEVGYKNGLKLLGIIILIGVISTHIFIMSLIVTGLACIVNLVRLKFDLEFIKKGLLLGLTVLVCSSYWLIPAIISPTGTPLATFGPEHWEVFKTAGSGYWGTLGNVLSLHGFWEEHEVWVSRFFLPKDGGFSFAVSLILLFSIISFGIYSGFRDRQLRVRVSFLIFVMFLAMVFSCGIGEGVFRNFNLWMFEHVSFWKGFRDSEKWSVLLALGYALLAGLGTRFILSYFQRQEYRRIVFYVLIAIPLLYTPMMLFGFIGQLKSVQYPNSWTEVNNVLKQDKNCRALFLPWQQYYSLHFNNEILTANLSRNYFDCDIVQGKNMNLGTVVSQGGNGEEYDAIEKEVTNNDANPDSVIEFLKGRGIEYIIFTDDVIGEDPYKYLFLRSKLLLKVINKGGIYLFYIL
jgi:hypothetical protein